MSGELHREVASEPIRRLHDDGLGTVPGKTRPCRPNARLCVRRAPCHRSSTLATLAASDAPLRWLDDELAAIVARAKLTVV